MSKYERSSLPMITHKPHKELLPHLFRQEFSKMTAVLCRHFGFKHIELAEDIASETFLKAFEIWPVKGIPENPTAWLYTVAKNKTKDYLRHRSVVENHLKDFATYMPSNHRTEFEFTDANIRDSQLAMMFAVSNATLNSTDAQISLALQILCGFSLQEIANAFLTNVETVKKRLRRARASLREQEFQLEALSSDDIQSGQTTVLRTLYLLFNEGYFSKTNSQIVRKDLCTEALRLALVLKQNVLTDTPQTNALIALMCFQSSRIEARQTQYGEAVLFENQDKDMWDKDLIDRGNFYLTTAFQARTTSKYHLEAAIAHWHACGNPDHKWPQILKLYDELIKTERSPITAYNRIFALAKVHGSLKALQEIKKLPAVESNYYFALLGYLNTNVDNEAAINFYRQAIKLTSSDCEKQRITTEINRLSSPMSGVPT